MRRPSLFDLACLAAACGPCRADPATAPNPVGFGYCPPPVVPGCLEASARRPGRPALEACGRDMLRFTQTLGAYRACLTRESERAIGSGNRAIARFRCLSQGGTACHAFRATER